MVSLLEAKTPLKERTTHVYQAINEVGTVLYVGITYDISQRMSQHKRESAWWGKHSQIVHNTYCSRTEALSVEAALISELDPPYNVAGTERFGKTMREAHIRRCKDRVTPSEPTFIASKNIIQPLLNEDHIFTLDTIIETLQFIKTMQRPNSTQGDVIGALTWFDLSLMWAKRGIERLGYELPEDLEWPKR
jgi:hypothetical protein